MIEYMKASKKDVIKYKVKWLLNIAFRFYCKYVELYDFEDIL